MAASKISSRSIELPEFIKQAQVLVRQYGELPKTNEPYEILKQAMRSFGIEFFVHDRITSLTVDFTERRDVPSGYDIKIGVQSARGALKIETVYTMPGERLALYGQQYKLEQELFAVRYALNEV